MAEHSNYICPICWEEFRPDTRRTCAIKVCGHVFCDVCLRDYQSRHTQGKLSCPTCKQMFKYPKDVMPIFLSSSAPAVESVDNSDKYESQITVLKEELRKTKMQLAEQNLELLHTRDVAKRYKQQLDEKERQERADGSRKRPLKETVVIQDSSSDEESISGVRVPPPPVMRPPARMQQSFSLLGPSAGYDPTRPVYRAPL